VTQMVGSVAASAVAAGAGLPAGAATELAGPGKDLAASPFAETPFADLIGDVVGDVNGLQAQAGAAVTGLMTGSGIDVHQAMIATEKASMAFELALAVRNKAVQAYQSVMSMQF